MRGKWMIGPVLLVGLVSCGSDDDKSAIAASVPDDWASYTSTRFLYSVRYPSDWVLTEATQDWPAAGFPFPGSPNTDKFADPVNFTTYFFVSSVDIAIGRVVAKELDIENQLFCEMSDRHTITVDGQDARQEHFFCGGLDYGIEVQLRTATQFYTINILSNSEFTDEQVATFESFLASFHATPA